MRLNHGWPLRRVYLLMACSFALVGCDDGRPATYRVEGTVTMKKGTPVPGGTVELQPVDTELKKFSALGQIGPDGKFRLTTFQEGDGAVAGEHRCVILPAFEQKKAWDESFRPTRVIPEKYTKYKTSPLRITVKKEDTTVRIVLNP